MEQNLWREVIRKCLAPARPSHRRTPENTRGLTTCWGRGEEDWQLRVQQQELGVCNYSEHAPLAPGARPPTPMSTALIRQLRSSWGLRRGQPARGEAQPPQMPPPPPSELPGLGRGPSRDSSRALPSASWSLHFGRFSSEPEDSASEEERVRPLPPRHFPVRLPLTPRSAGKRSQWPRDHLGSFPHRHPRSVADTVSRPQHLTPAHLTSGGSGSAGHRKLLGPRLRLSSTLSSVNSACFSTKWRRRSRAHVAAFPLPVPISSFAARPRRDGPSTSQWPYSACGFHPITDGCPRI